MMDRQEMRKAFRSLSDSIPFARIIEQIEAERSAILELLSTASLDDIRVLQGKAQALADLLDMQDNDR